MPTAGRAAPMLRHKLKPASGPNRLLERVRLGPPAAFLDGARRVALIAAPAGYGKTTLMRQWRDALQGQGCRCAWLSLDGDDQDPARLMRHLIAALQGLAPALGAAALTQLTASLSGDSVKAALENLAADLEAVEGRAALLVDDLHFAGRDGVEIINWLINYAPPQFQFVLGCRQLPALKLGGLRVRQQLHELGRRELTFSAAEAGEFCAARLGAALAPGDLARLFDKTEGWPAALELAALALRDEVDRSALVRRFAGTARGVVDYLAEAVLEGLDARTRRFLLVTAQFDRISAPLAAEVSGEALAAELLEQLIARNLFLVPLDGEAGSLRYHHLAADFLRERYRREYGSPATTLVVGARWLFARGCAEEAINLAIRAEDWDAATAWIAESVEELVYRRGYHHTIMRWMQELPAEAVDRYPTIRIHYAFALIFSSHPAGAEAQAHRLEAIRERLVQAPDADRRLLARIAREVEMQQVIRHALRDEGLQARDSAAAWLERWPEAPLIRRGTAANVYAFGLKTAGDIDRGLEAAARARGWLNQAEGWYSLAWTEYLTALLHLKRGALFEARRAAEAGLALLDRHLNGHPAHAAILHTVLAAVAYEFDELDAVRRHLERCMPRVVEAGHADAVLMGYLIEARLRRLEQGEAAGIEKLHEGQEAGARRGFGRVAVSLAGEECSWHARAGRFGEARQVAARHGFGQPPEAGTERSLASTVAILSASRYQLRETPAAVIARLQPAIARCREHGLYRRWVELLLIQSAAQRQAGQCAPAARSLEEALDLAAPRGCYRTLLDFSAELGETLAGLAPARLESSAAEPLLRRLRSALSARNAAKPAEEGGKQPLVEPLSKREQGILRRLESGLSLEEIADSIFISRGTLKWHVQNIYGKLAVKNRSGAVARGRELRLI